MTTIKEQQFRYIEHPTYIDSNETLARFCLQWKRCDMLALDTEFIRTDTFYPKGALLQVSDGKGAFLIDPLTIDDFSPLVNLLVDESIVKVVHSCSEDLEVFDRLFSVLPSPLFDTQIAASMVGYGFSVGYQALTEKMLGIHVAKGETRSNWLQRPLTESQIHYAALDVVYLADMYQILVDSLTAKGRLHWLLDDCRQLVNVDTDQQKINSYYKKVKSAWKLTAQELTLLQLLIQWREGLAREKDIPRGRVIKDQYCFDIARLKPKSLADFSSVKELSAKFVRHYGEIIIAMVKDVGRKSADEYLYCLPKPLPGQKGSLLKALKSHVVHRAEHLKLAPEILARKKDLEQLIRSGSGNSSYQLPESLSGWRKGVIGDDLLAIIAKR